MENKKKELIELIAKENRVLIGSDDPILILLTANEYLIKNLHIELDSILKYYSSELELLATKREKLATQKAEKILNVALDASKKNLTTHTEEIFLKITDKIKDEILAAKINIKNERKKLEIFFVINIIFCFFITGAIFLR